MENTQKGLLIIVNNAKKLDDFYPHSYGFISPIELVKNHISLKKYQK